MGIHSVFAQLSSARPPRQYVSLCEEANGCPPANWPWNWLWNWQWNCHDDVPTVHATSACADYGSPTVLDNLLPQHGSQAGKGSIRWYRWHGLPSPADDGSASACADYGSPAVHATS